MARLGRSIPIGARIVRGAVAPGLLVGALLDDFDDNAIDPSRWPGNFGVTAESGGRARVECSTGLSAFQSAKIYGLPGSAAVVQVYSPAASGATTAFGEIVIASDQQPAGTQLSLRADAATGQLTASIQVGYVDGSATSAPYDPSSPIWLRIRESSGQLTFEYSTTGFSSSWATLRTAGTPDWVTTSAVGVYLQAYRDSGVSDFVDFDNVGLVPADPIPAPDPIVIRGQRLRPLPPGAIVMRTKDVRLPPSNKTAVGLDGSMRVPLAVRLTTAQADVLLVAEVRDVSFRSVIPGGYASATVSLDRPLNQAVPEIALYAKLRIYDTRDGATVWEGRVEDPGRSAGGDGQIWQITAIGPSAHARDETFPYVPIDTSFQHFEKFGGSLNSANVSTGTHATAGDGVKVQFSGGIAVSAPVYVSAYTVQFRDAGLQLASVSAVATGGGSGEWDMRMYVYGPSGAQLVDNNLLQTSPIFYRGTVGSDFSAGQTMLHLRMDRTGGVTQPDDNAYTFWSDVCIRSTLVTEEGVAVTDYSQDYVLSSEVIQDLVGRHLPMYDGYDAYIEITSTQITQLAYPDGTTAHDVFQDLMAREGAYYWASWESLPNGKFRFEWRPWPTSVKWEADVIDGFDSPGSAADLYNAVTVRWKDSLGRAQSTRVTSTVADLDAAGLDRDAEIDMGQETGTAAAALAAGQVFLAEHALPTNRGRLTVARPILDLERGMMVDPWQIRPGGLIRVRGVHARADALNAIGRDGATVFRIVATSFNANDGTAELELDADAISTTRAIAALQQRRTRSRH